MLFEEYILVQIQIISNMLGFFLREIVLFFSVQLLFIVLPGIQLRNKDHTMQFIWLCHMPWTIVSEQQTAEAIIWMNPLGWNVCTCLKIIKATTNTRKSLEVVHKHKNYMSFKTI